MGINEIIQQKSFASEAQKAFVNIAYTQSNMTNELNSVLKPHKISMQQFNVLRILKGHSPKPISINEISNRMVDRMSNASRLVDKLCKKGFAQREISERDKRQADIKITPKGEDFLLQLNRVVDQKIGEYKTCLSDDEFVTLNLLLDKLNKS